MVGKGPAMGGYDPLRLRIGVETFDVVRRALSPQPLQPQISSQRNNFPPTAARGQARFR
jgi:hypothetical protein